MPDEFRSWQEKISSIEKKKATGVAAGKSDLLMHNVSRISHTENRNFRTIETSFKNSDDVLSSSTPELTFATNEDAQDSFKSMLSHYKVSTTAKLKEVQDQCQSDPRWDVIKSQGEKKQCLAEYQVLISF